MNENNEMFFVAIVKSFYGPSEKLSWLVDESGHRAEFATIEKAREAIKDYCSEPYVCEHNEVGLPDLYVVPAFVETWTEDTDGGKFDWDGCECEDRATDDELDDICDGYSVCDSERYGSVAGLYEDDSIPTNAEFWRACGQSYDGADKDDPIETISLAEYVRGHSDLSDWSKNIASDIPHDIKRKVDDWVERLGEYCCGECDSCIDHMNRKTIGYIREHAITEEG